MTTPQFELGHRDLGSALVVEVVGELDLATSEELGTLLDSTAARPVVVVDLSRVSFIDSTTLSLLISARDRLRSEGSSCRLVICTPIVERVFDVTGLRDVFDTYRSVDDALRDAGSAATSG